MDVNSRDLVADIVYQIGALQALAATLDMQVSYVKPHGALYNTIAFDTRQASDMIQAIQSLDPRLKLVVLAGSRACTLAQEAGLSVIQEAFADRAYTPSGGLVPRSQSGAMLHDPQVVAQRMLRLVQDGHIQAIDGSLVRIDAQSICVHGDSTGAVAMASAVKKNLVSHGIHITPFAPPSTKPNSLSPTKKRGCND